MDDSLGASVVSELLEHPYFRNWWVNVHETKQEEIIETINEGAAKWTLETLTQFKATLDERNKR